MDATKVKEYDAIHNALEQWIASQGITEAQANIAMCMSIGTRIGRVATGLDTLLNGLAIHSDLMASYAIKAARR